MNIRNAIFSVFFCSFFLHFHMQILFSFYFISLSQACDSLHERERKKIGIIIGFFISTMIIVIFLKQNSNLLYIPCFALSFSPIIKYLFEGCGNVGGRGCRAGEVRPKKGRGRATASRAGETG